MESGNLWHCHNEAFSVTHIDNAIRLELFAITLRYMQHKDIILQKYLEIFLLLRKYLPSNHIEYAQWFWSGSLTKVNMLECEKVVFSFHRIFLYWLRLGLWAEKYLKVPLLWVVAMEIVSHLPMNFHSHSKSHKHLFCETNVNFSNFALL